jgi:hypothetical protein
MGLDMNLYGRKSLWTHDENNVRKEDGFPVGVVELELGYWRKHPNLHGYIVNEFAKGVDECQKIDLDAEALSKIAVAVRANKLPHTTGFFFGSSDWWADQTEEVAAVFDRARAWTAMKDRDHEFYRYVYYQASW